MKQQLAEILHRINKVRIGVIGDFCLDAYWQIDEAAAEISVETGLHTLPVHAQRYFPGGAGNVAANLAALAVAEVHAFGVTGQDVFAGELRRLLQKNRTIIDGLLVQEKDWQTCVYIKQIIAGTEQRRIDFGNFNQLYEKTADRLLANLSKKLPKLDAVIINQQLVRGIHTACFREKLSGMIRQNAKTKFIVDSRHFGDEFPGAIRKINDREACELCSISLQPGMTVPGKQAIAAAKTLANRWHKLIFVTRGAEGVLVANSGTVDEIPAAKIAGPIDTVGAGDTLLAALCAAIAAGENPVNAARLGTLAAAVSIQKLQQCGTASPEEIIKQAENE